MAIAVLARRLVAQRNRAVLARVARGATHAHTARTLAPARAGLWARTGRISDRVILSRHYGAEARSH